MFKCGFYEKEITPPLGGHIPGYFYGRPATDVKSRLYAKAIAIEADGKCIIMITVDSLHMPQSVHDTAIEIIKKHTGIESRYIMINATHCHTAGPIRARPGKYSDPKTIADDEYTAMLGRMAGDCGVLAYRRLEPMTAKYAKSDLYGVAFVRNYIMKDGNVRTNPGYLNPDIVRPFVEIDPEFPAFYFYDESGKPRGVITNYGNHHDCVGGSEYCADYSGVLSDKLKNEFGKDFVSIFINGDCGNVNHCNFNISYEEFRSSPSHLRIGQAMFERVIEMSKTAEPFEIDSVDGMKEDIEMRRREIPEEAVEEYKRLIEEIPDTKGLSFSITEPESQGYKRMISEKMLNYSETPIVQYHAIQALRFGECILFATPAEMYNDYGKYMKANSPSKINMVAELANGAPACYIPSPEMFDYGAYESAVASAPYEKETGYNMAKFAVELGKKIYK